MDGAPFSSSVGKPDSSLGDEAWCTHASTLKLAQVGTAAAKLRVRWRLQATRLFRSSQFVHT